MKRTTKKATTGKVKSVARKPASRMKTKAKLAATQAPISFAELEAPISVAELAIVYDAAVHLRDFYCVKSEAEGRVGVAHVNGLVARWRDLVWRNCSARRAARRLVQAYVQLEQRLVEEDYFEGFGSWSNSEILTDLVFWFIPARERVFGVYQALYALGDRINEDVTAEQRRADQ